MQEFTSFFIIVFVGVFFSMVRRRLHLPWVVALILGGILVGPHVLDILEITPVTQFLGDVGLIFLMFMAGLETRLSAFSDFKGGLVLLAFINGAIPFVVGFGITLFFGYELITALLIGIIFIASSISIVIPSLEARNFLGTRLGQSVVMTSVIQDVASLILLSLILQSYSPITHLPLYLFYPLTLLVIVAFRYLLPRLESYINSVFKDRRDVFQQEFRTTFLILLGTVAVFELLGLHPIIGGFFAGFVLSETIKSPVLKEKIRTISYGIFIPIFFVIVGVRTDISIFFEPSVSLLVIGSIVAGSILAKLFSGWVGARIVGFPSDQALLFSISSIAQLSTTLAVTFAAFALGLIDETLVAAMVTLSVITVFAAPTLMDIFGKRIKESLPIMDRRRAKKTKTPPVQKMGS